MEPLLPVDAQMASFDDEKLLQMLGHASSSIRARVLPTLGPRIQNNAHTKEALFLSAADPVNLELTFYAFIKVAWIAAIAVLDYGIAEDYSCLKQIVSQWPATEQRGFLAYIKDYQSFASVCKQDEKR